jgi:hypothetical protein
MIQAKILNKHNIEIFRTTLNDQSELSNWLELIGETKGKPERWVLENSESYNESDVLEEELIINEDTGDTETMVLLKADYTIEIIDLEKDYDYLLQQCYENRKKEYPIIEELANALFWKEQGDSSKYDEYIKKCEEVKSKYPKPIKENL